MITALLDADIAIWKSAALSQDVIDLGDGGPPIRRPNWPRMRGLAHAMLQRWASAVKAKEFIVVVSDRREGGRSFRFDLFDEYHANRKSMPRPDLLMDLHWDIVNTYDAVFHPGLEGDDVLAILSTSGEYKNPVIVTEDKDFRTVPGKVFFPTRSKTALNVTKLGAARYWFAQALIGDPADNYKGAYGCGQKTTAAILDGLQTEEELWEATRRTFLAYGHNEEYAIQQVRLARILRAEDIDEDWTTIRLWHPTTPEYYTLPIIKD